MRLYDATDEAHLEAATVFDDDRREDDAYQRRALAHAAPEDGLDALASLPLFQPRRPS